MAAQVASDDNLKTGGAALADSSIGRVFFYCSLTGAEEGINTHETRETTERADTKLRRQLRLQSCCAQDRRVVGKRDCLCGRAIARAQDLRPYQCPHHATFADHDLGSRSKKFKIPC